MGAITDECKSATDKSKIFNVHWKQTGSLSWIFLQRTLTADETCLHWYYPEGKIQSKQWLPRGAGGPVEGKTEQLGQYFLEV